MDKINAYTEQFVEDSVDSDGMDSWEAGFVLGAEGIWEDPELAEEEL